MPEPIVGDLNGGGGGQITDPDPKIVVDPNVVVDPKVVVDPLPGADDKSVFYNSIPEANRGDFKDFEGKDVGEFVKHYKALKDGQVVVPESYEPVEAIEIKNQGNYDQLTTFCKTELGLTQAQFAKLLPAMVQRDQAVLNEFQKSVTSFNDGEFDKLLAEEETAAKDSLTREWGGEYGTKVAKASGLVAALADDDFVEYLTETGLGNDPRMLKAFYRLSTYISEDSFIEGKVDDNDVRRDPQTGAPMLKFKKMD